MICARCGAETGAAGGVNQCVECAADPRLDGRYRLEVLLGQGTHGMTYRARGPAGEQVAVKMVNLGHRLTAERRAALDREVEVLRSIDHARVPAMLDDFTVRSGMTRYRCIVQTFVDGPDLAGVVRERRPTVADVLGWVADIADVLDWLHRLAPPIIHRDIKPNNVLRRRVDGALVLIDFGSVRDTVVETLGGTMGIGTAGYMAPEQIVGDVSPKSDVFSLGATAIELLTRRPPHDLRERSGRLVWPSSAFPPAVVALVDRMVDPAPERRPSAAETRDEARRLAADPDAVAETPLSLARPVRKPRSSSPAVRSAAAAPTPKPRAARSARAALGLLAIAAVIGTVASPFVAEVSAWAGLIGAPIAVFALWQSLKAGVKRGAAVAGSALGVILALFVAVNLLSIGPMDARSVFPWVLVPYVMLALRPWGKAMIGLSRAARGVALDGTLPDGTLPDGTLPDGTLPDGTPGQTALAPTEPTPAMLHRKAQRAASISGVAMVLAGVAAFEDVESLMISAPVAVVLGLWTTWRGRRAALRPVELMGLSMPAGALALFVAVEFFRMSYWDNRHGLATATFVYGVLMALLSMMVRFFKPPRDGAD